MLYHKLIVALFALPFALAQDPSPADGDNAAAPAESPAAGGDPNASPAAGGDPNASPAAATATRKPGGSVGGNTENTGHGISANGTGGWNVTSFIVPNTEVWWVNEAVNEARWNPYTEDVDLVIFNSNTTLLAENRQVASKIPAGTGTWSGMISGFLPGNNYILVLALSRDPTRKIAQTPGFWIRRNGTLAAPLPSLSAGAGQTVSGGVAASGTAVPSAPASTSTQGAAGQQGGGAGQLAVSLGGLLAAGALALTAF